MYVYSTVALPLWDECRNALSVACFALIPDGDEQLLTRLSLR